MTESTDPDRRRSPRFAIRHPVEGTSQDGRIGFRGILHSLSATGCGLHLDRPLSVGAPIEFRCNVNGIGLAIRGRTVWTTAALGGILHGVDVTGFASDQDALFHRLYLNLLSRRSSPCPGD
ncbi:MAG: PilZ domain-containing protein [candidate division NC10 bacterium]|nr:PilZ domain-containing protein [candidate division NC10 bacterium]